MTTFYRVQVRALEAQEFLKGPMRQMLFVVFLSNGMVVEPGGPHASPKGLRHGFGVTAVSKGIALNMVQKMARSLATDHYGYLCERRRGRRAKHRIEDVDLNRINLITPGGPTLLKSLGR